MTRQHCMHTTTSVAPPEQVCCYCGAKIQFVQRIKEGHGKYAPSEYHMKTICWTTLSTDCIENVEER
jgi:hypothetical protein